MLNHVSRSGVLAGEGAMADMGLRAQSLFFFEMWIGCLSGAYFGSRLPQKIIIVR